MNDYITHRKHLEHILSILDYTKPVHCLEFGVGEGSSSLFYEYAKQNKNLLIDAYESDDVWLNQTKSKFQSDNYFFINVEDWNEFDFETLKQNNYDLVFIDQKPWEARILTLDNLKNNSKYIVLHDYNYYTKFNGDDFFEKYKSNLILEEKNELDPPTLILKNELLLQK